MINKLGMYRCRILLDITHLSVCALHTPPGPKGPGVRQPPNIRFKTRLEIARETVIFIPNLDIFSNTFPVFYIL